MRYDVQIPQRSMNAEKLEAEIVSDDKNQYAVLSVDGQKVSLPFQVIDILHHEAEVVRYSEYVREMWAEDYEGELSDEKVREISESMLGYLTQFGDEYEIEELNAQLVSDALSHLLAPALGADNALAQLDLIAYAALGDLLRQQQRIA